MLNYQSTSFHDALYLRRALGLRPAPEFEAWLNGDHFPKLRHQAAVLTLNPDTQNADTLLGKPLPA
jgi:ethanolamine ammonia-lyase large subunit